MKEKLKTSLFLLLAWLTAPIWIVALIIWAGVENRDRYDINLEDLHEESQVKL